MTYNQETAVCLFPERAISRLWAVVKLCVLVSVHERTSLNIRWVSRLLKRVFIVFFDRLSECTCSSVVISYWWHQQRPPALKSAAVVVIMLKNIVYDRKYPYVCKKRTYPLNNIIPVNDSVLLIPVQLLLISVKCSALAFQWRAVFVWKTEVITLNLVILCFK